MTKSNRGLNRRQAIAKITTGVAGIPLLSELSGESPAQSNQSSAPRPTPPTDWDRYAPRDLPNFVFFVTDDHRQDAMSAYGNKILKTPNMDRVASEGVRFTESFVTNPLCGPSRATILTGLYSHTHGVTTNGAKPYFRFQQGLAENQQTFPEILQKAGYHTAVVGKWHINSWPTGFDQWVILPGQGSYQDPEMIANGARIKLRGHAEDVVTDQALLYLQNKPKDKPFCLLIHFKAPHSAWVPAARFERAFEDVEFPLPKTFDDNFEGRSGAVRQNTMPVETMNEFDNRGLVPRALSGVEREKFIYQLYMRNYYRVLLGADENVGRVLDYLDENGLSDNTAVIYTSDNGLFMGEHGLRDKRLVYEQAIRVPVMLRHKGRIKPQVNSSHMVLNTDFAPTVLEMAGVKPPQWMHGASWAPLTRRQNVPWRDACLLEYFEYPSNHCIRKTRAVRTDRWKLLHFWERPEEWELYDLKNDPDEVVNLSDKAEHLSRVKELRAKLEELRREVGDADPPGPPPAAAPCEDMRPRTL